MYSFLSEWCLTATLNAIPVNNGSYMKYIISTFLCFLSVYIHAETLTILNWEEYLSDQVIEEWEGLSGHTIKQIYFDSDENRNVILTSGTTSIDLVISDAKTAPAFGRKGTFLALEDYVGVPNLNHVDKNWQTRCGEHAVAYLWGTLGLAYRSDKLVKPPESWAAILSPVDALKGHIGMMEDRSDMIAPALFMQGVSMNTANILELKSAFETLKMVMPNLLTMEYSVSFLEDDPKKDQLYITLAYSGDQHILNEKSNSKVWRYTALKEGTGAWIDCMAILKHSRNKALAFDFINYLNKPNIAALNSEDLYVASPSSAAKALQSKDFLSDQTVYPSAAVMAKVQYYEVLTHENILLRNRITNSLVRVYESK
jgi:spermidine/putrescine transport system substrate-binding protein